MFQTFEATTSPETGAPRLAALREQLQAEGLAGFLVPRADAHQGEYVTEADKRLAWLTGFTGSAGFCAALRDVAGVFIDGRYRVQVRAQVDTDVFTPVKWPETKLGDWLPQHLGNGDVLGFDPWLHTVAEIETLTTALEGSGIALRPVDNLVDRIRQDRPAQPQDPMVPYPETLAGQSSAEKRVELGETLAGKGRDALVITQPDAIAWLLNTRGTDLGQTPVALAFAILKADGKAALFIDPAKVDDSLRQHLGNAVSVEPPEAFGPALTALSGTVLADKGTLPVWVADRVRDGDTELVFDTDPLALAKACKNDTEIAGTREAHLRDGAAFAEFLAWLDGQGNAPDLTEIDVVKKLESFRAATGELRNISFDTISGSGPNGAIVHYRVTEDTNRHLQSNELLLVDSGAQYEDGTTDITRTVAIGTPPPEAVAAFTRVLKGMIAISRLRFPKGLAGRDIDALARAALWEAGLDYDHGTGHGVGVYLGVHEGPQRISRASGVPLRAGMILSNEPGYYREGAFGIRIENLIVVREAAPIPGADDREWLEFETLTFAPIDRHLIDPDMLTDAERDWLDSYHTQVEARLADRVTPQTRSWLQAACKAL